MIVLFQPPTPPGWGVPNMSPFCVKLETYLRMAKLEYRSEAGNPIQAPKGKIPYVSVDGKLMGDSGLIIDYLRQTRGDPLDGKLTAEQRARALAIRRLAEEHLYFCGAHLRWADEESYGHVKRFLKGILPPVIGPLVMKKLRRDFFAAMRGQGVSRHSRAEILAMAKEDLEALSTLLGDQPYFLGAEPTSLDAAMYGLLIQFFWVPWESDLTRMAKGMPNLVAYCDRMKARYWS